VSHVEYEFRPELSHPVMTCAFAGWNDGGEAASTAVRYARDRWRARRFAGIDPEEFFDFQVNRPVVSLEAGASRRLDWPACEFFHARPGGRDVLLFLGVEPNLRWRAFCASILEVASELRVELLVTLGAFLADVPHTRPVPVNAASTDPAWIGRLGIAPSRYEGPTGIVGALHDAAGKARLPSVSLWAAAPHYLPSGTNPKVALALLEGLEELLDVDVDTADMQRATRVWEKQVREAIDEDPNLASYVRRLEEAAEERHDEGGTLGEIPSGEQIAEELERFLRDERGGST
jgi:proteasome assembly chaperone (PAC2) family protein